MDPATQTFLTAVFSFLPEPYRTYAASAVGIAGVLSMVASVVAARVKPPSSAAPSWKRTLYTVVTWPAFNLGWARNAVLPGMPRAVQEAALVSAKLAAAAPELTTVAVPPAVAGAITPAPAN